MSKITIKTKYDTDDKCYYAHIKETDSFGDGDTEYKAVLDAIQVYFDILNWHKEDVVEVDISEI